jgi:undecaprenyl-diphosphatase
MEFSFVEWLNRWGGGWINPFTELICNEYLLVILWSVTFIALLTHPGNKKILIKVIVALILFWVINEVLIKNLLADYFWRTRPYLADNSIAPLGHRYTDSSFPSSHLASTLAILSVYFYYYRQYWPAMGVFVILLAFARIHNGMHYPSDVAAGIILGICYGAMAIGIVNRAYSKKNNS